MSARKHGFFRRPRTTQERKWNGAHRKYVRGGRSPRMIPTAWEDMYKSAAECKSWKSKFKKRKQWMITPFKEEWLLRLGYWVTPNCYNRRLHRYSAPVRCPGCPICHKRSERNW